MYYNKKQFGLDVLDVHILKFGAFGIKFVGIFRMTFVHVFYFENTHTLMYFVFQIHLLICIQSRLYFKYMSHVCFSKVFCICLSISEIHILPSTVY